jgi:putative membrane protein
MRLLLVWLLNAIALIGVTYVVPGISITGLWGQQGIITALVAALVLGLVNTIIRPLIVLLTLPVTILTLGLFYFVINGLLFWAVGSLLQGFNVSGFWAGFFGAIVYGLIGWALSMLLPKKVKK